MITPEQATNYVEEKTTDIAALLAVAKDMISDYVADAAVPESILDNATLVLVQELALRQQSPGGIVSYAGEDQALRLSRDPMTPVYPLLRRYVWGIA